MFTIDIIFYLFLWSKINANSIISNAMKSNYILDTFESLVREIKNIHFSLEQNNYNTITESDFDNALCYSVTFQEDNGKINYVCSDAINNLHPCHVELQFHTSAVAQRYLKLIDSIISQLKIKSYTKEFNWQNTPNGIQLNIKVYPKVEKETQEIRFFNHCFHILKNETEVIENSIKTKVLKCKSSAQSTQYIQKNQHALHQFISKLIKRINPNSVADLYTISNNFDRLDSLKLTFIFVEKILALLESEYGSFLDQSIKVSNHTIIKSQSELAHQCDFIKSKINNAKLNNELTNVAFSPIDKFQNNYVNEQLTNFEFNYFCKYINKTYKQLKNLEIELSNEILSDWLFEINLNSLPFFDYLTEKYKSQLQPLESVNQRLDTLYFFLKNVNQKPNVVSIKFRSKLPPIKQQLINWLEEEIDYLRKKMMLENNVTSTAAEETKIKLHSGLTVAQLSYFSNLLLKSEIIKHENQSEVFQFMATNFKTNVTDKISPESFRSKYYNVEDSTKHFVREKIIDLLNLTKS